MLKQGTSFAVLSAALMLFSIDPAFAGPAASFLEPKKPISAPAGFSGVCGRYSWACARSSAGTKNASQMLQVAKRINAEVNRSVREIEDRQLYGRDDYWTLPVGGKGDCEDFALLKKRKLIEAGVPASNLLIATALPRGQRKLHAVLIVRTDKGDFVLDNLNRSVRHWKQTGYTFLTMQRPGQPSRWDTIFMGPRIQSASNASS